MTRQKLIRALSERTGLSRADATAALEALLEIMRDSLQQGEAITLRGFGTFRLKYQRPRKGRVIRTGQTVTVPSRLRVSFIPSLQLQGPIQENRELLKRLAPK